MDMNELLRGVDCDCGRHHSCAIGAVYVERNVAARLPKLCEGYSSILLVADENTYGVSGAGVETYVGSKIADRVIFTGKTVLIPNEDAIETVYAHMEAIDLIVGIGSGVIQDLCKYVSHTKGVPYYIVATAPSMDGYASSGAAMITGGMKVTYSAKVPDAILADTDVIKDAPMDMIQAGYGDIIGKYSALNDWKLGAAVNDEYFCPFIYGLTMDMVKKVLPLNEKLLARDGESVQLLMEALVFVGIAMSFAGSSRPASGSEHHLSHFFEITGIVHKQAYFRPASGSEHHLSHYFEITGIVDGTPYLPHGIDVVFSTAITSRIREKLVKAQWPAKQFRQSDEEYAAELGRTYKSVAQGCMDLQAKLGTYEQDRVSVYKAKEEALKAILAEVPTGAEIEKILLGIGLNIDDFFKFYGEEKIRDAVRYAKDLKDRYSVLWMYYDLFGVEEV